MAIRRATRPPTDFRAIRRYGIAHVAGGAIVSTLAVAALTIEYVHDRAAHIATARAWNIQGPPCPALSEAEFLAKRWTASKTFNYGDVTLGRAAGDASCSDVKEDAGKGLFNDRVCQFTSPAALTVVSRSGRYYFLPGVGQPATISIHRDVPKCVMASNFTLQSE
jgi:hypothetical protein